jgi:hypothetical protein
MRATNHLMDPMESERPSSSAPERRSVPARWLALASAGGAARLVLVAFVAYRSLLYYERRAIEHVPAGAELALRVDLEQVVLFEPVRRHLLPLLDRLPVGDAVESAPSSRLVRLREAGLNLGLDLRELVFARVQPGAGWLLALGGIFGNEPLIPRVERVLRDEPGAHLRSEGGTIIFEPSGAALGQAADGVLLLASDAQLLARAMPAGHGNEAVGLSPKGAAAFAALGSWLDALGSPSAGASSAASSLVRASARLELGDTLGLTIDIEHRQPIDIATVRRELDGWLGSPSDDANFAPQADWGGERAVAARAQLTQSAPARVRVRTWWTRGELDRAARSLATWLEAQLHAVGPAAR